MSTIPKKIHYVWLGKAKLPASVIDCIKSWKKHMPEYEIKCWSEENFDLNSVDWVNEAIEQKKWSFASDYIRHYALFTEGGIYLNTDVKVFKSFDVFLDWDFFSSVEYHPKVFRTLGEKQLDSNKHALIPNDYIDGLGILAACFGSKKGNPYIKECMDFFSSKHFVKEDGSLFTDIINPGIMATIATKYGFVYDDVEQKLQGNMKIYNSSVFAGDLSTLKSNSYSMHYCDGSWRDNSLIHKIKSDIKKVFFRY